MEQGGPREVYSPRDIAEFCAAGIDDVFQWIETGKLKSFEVPGGHRRIRHADLVCFFREEKGDLFPAGEGPVQKQKVLIVEDDPDLLEIVTELLKDEDRIDVRSENNGFTAGLQIAGWHPDLILLDFLMPGISGFDLCRKLRGNEETSDIPVLALTSLASHEDRQAIFDSGASDYLGKPFHSEELLGKVRILLGLEKTGHA